MKFIRRGAVYNTDHHLVCVKLHLQRDWHAKHKSVKNKRFDVVKLSVRSEDGKRDSEVRDKFVQSVLSIEPVKNGVMEQV